MPENPTAAPTPFASPAPPPGSDARPVAIGLPPPTRARLLDVAAELDTLGLHDAAERVVSMATR